MKVLVINCGSSSIKFQLLEMENEMLLAKGQVERIGMDGSLLNFLESTNMSLKSKGPYLIIKLGSS